MSLRAGDFMKARVRDIAFDSLDDRLLVEHYIEHVYSNLVENNEVFDKVRPLARGERGALHDFENVLLRFNEPKKWRDFAQATIKRKGGKIGEALEAFVKGDHRLLPLSDGLLPDAHPVRRAMSEARDIVLYSLEESGALDDAMRDRWTTLLDTVDCQIGDAATREWLCYSLRRAFFNEASS